MEMHDCSDQLLSRATLERLNKTVYEYAEQTKRVLHVDTDLQHDDTA